MKRYLLAFVILLTLTSIIWSVFRWKNNQPEVIVVSDSVTELLGNKPSSSVDEIPQKIELSDEVEAALPTGSEKETMEVVKEIIPPEVLLDVPFIVQAPNANWDLPYSEACEEASIMMVHNFLEGDILTTQDEMKEEIDSIIFWGDDQFGSFDTTAQTSSRYFTEKLGYNSDSIHVIYDMTINDLKAVLAEGYPVIVPAAGRELGNKYFQTPGPLYHMLVLVGYDGNEFITNDPGTKNGEGYRYNQEVLYNAIHDLTDDLEAITTGRKAMIVVKP
jgi:hypothetical protein